MTPKGPEEHIFPKWLQHRFDLWDTTLTPFNGTSIPYCYLTVTACQKCNNEHLKKIEDVIREAVLAGYDAVKKLPHITYHHFSVAFQNRFRVLMCHTGFPLDYLFHPPGKVRTSLVDDKMRVLDMPLDGE